MTAFACAWFHTHNAHCFYTALYASRTGAVPNADGSTSPAPQALLDFLALPVAPGAAEAPPAPAGAALQRPALLYVCGVGPFCAVVEEKPPAKAA